VGTSLNCTDKSFLDGMNKEGQQEPGSLTLLITDRWLQQRDAKRTGVQVL
jgi:hypothetical protein